MAIFIKEFLPNPPGKDREGEYFSLSNDSELNISLSGWRVEDESGKAFWLPGQIEAGGERSFPSRESGLAINNDGETLFLFNERSELVDELGYSGSALEGLLISKSPQMSEEIIQEYFSPLASKALSASAINTSEGPWAVLIASSVLLALLATLALEWAGQLYEKSSEGKGAGSNS